MAVEISCPKCSKEFNVVNAFPGSKIDCPECKCIIIVDLDIKYSRTKNTIEAVKASLPEQKTSLYNQAVNHLETWLDVSSEHIKSALNLIDENKAYEVWKIPKNGNFSFREITSPCKVLKLIQRRILDRLLYRIPVSNASHGFVPGRSIVTNAEFHLKTAAAILNLDLKDAFPSVNKQRVKHLYVRYLKIPLKHLGENISHEALDKVIDFLVKLTVHNDQLPQGSPCSGYLLNVACITLDKTIYSMLRQEGLSYRYTRYADDITISQPNTITKDFQERVKQIILNAGFKVNPQKIKYTVRSKGQKLEVTGLILEKGKVRISAEKLDTFRAIIHQATNIESENLTPEKRLEIQSIVAFVKMVYKKIPHRIWKPYRIYMDKHGLKYPVKSTKSFLDLYPNSFSHQ